MEYIQEFDTRKYMNRADFEIFHYRGTSPEEKEVHHHDFYEIFFLISGKITYWAEDRTYHLKAGDILLMNPMVLHRPIPEGGSSGYDRIVLWINKEYLEKISSNETKLYRCFENSMSPNTNHLHTTKSLKNSMQTRLEDLVKEFYCEEFGSRICAEGILRQFMVELNRFFENAAVEQGNKKEFSTLVTDVIEYIGENYMEDLSLDTLASHFYVSKYHLSHEFSGAMGTGVYRYIMLKRLLVARQLLLKGVSANEACTKCGFKDYTNFYRAFKAEYGISPSEVNK